MIDAAFTSGFRTDAEADEAIRFFGRVSAHAPESCADWLPLHSNSLQFCLAIVETGIGFARSHRPVPDFSAGEKFYDKALQRVPHFCPATRRKAELYVQKATSAKNSPLQEGTTAKKSTLLSARADELENKIAAQQLFLAACTGCGPHSLDMMGIREIWAQVGWALPCRSECGGKGAKKCFVESEVVKTVEELRRNSTATGVKNVDLADVLAGGGAEVSTAQTSSCHIISSVVYWKMILHKLQYF